MRDDDAIATDDEQGDAAEQARLSRAAREAVRHPADPRIDRQLARMGLAPDADDAAEVRNASTTELQEVRSAIAMADEVAAETTRRIDRLTLAVSLEAVAIVVLAVLLLLR
jgi:hypothetical protein